LTNPVVAALANAKRREQDEQEARLCAAIHARLKLPPPTGDRSEWPAFAQWAKEKSLTAYPARPGVVALYLLENAALGIDRLEKVVESISAVHEWQGVADPTASDMVSAALNQVAPIAPIAPPRSWSAAERPRFLSLPRAMQKYLAAREADRDKEVRRAQGEVGKLKQELRKIQDGKTATTAAAAAASAA
jgi:hypothetical protein